MLSLAEFYILNFGLSPRTEAVVDTLHRKSIYICGGALHMPPLAERGVYLNGVIAVRTRQTTSGRRSHEPIEILKKRQATGSKLAPPVATAP